MATTYFDAYTVVDTINAQSPSSTQYSSNEASGTITTDSYSSSVSHTNGAITDDGFSQKSLYEMCLELQTNWDEAMASFDTEIGLGTTTYEAGAEIGSLSGDYSSAAIAALLALGIPNVKKVNLYPEGMSTYDVAVFCQAFASMFAAATALLDADSGTSDSDYASTLNIVFTAKTGWIPPLTTSTAFNITNTASKIKTNGIHNEALVDFLNTAVTNMNALWVKVDADLTP